MGSHCVCRTRTTCGSGGLIKSEEAILHFLLPILLAYTGGKMVEPIRGGVSGAIAILGMILTSQFPQVFGAMIIGPLTGGMLRFFDHIFSRKVKTGYEMLFFVIFLQA